MAVCSVKIVSIIGTNASLDSVSRICGSSGFFQPINIQDFCANPEGLIPFSEPSPYSEFSKQLENAATVFGKKLKYVDIDHFNAGISEIKNFIDDFGKSSKKLNIQKKELVKSISDLERSLTLIRHFCGLNLDFEEISRCEYVTVRFGRLSKESYEKLKGLKGDSYIMFFPCSKEENYYWGIYFAPVENLKEIDSFFSGLYFEHVKINFKDYGTTPEQSVKLLEDRIRAEKEKLKNVETQMERVWDGQKDQCSRFYTKLAELETFFSIKRYSYVHSESFLLMGWVPDEKEVELSNLLDDVDGVEYKFQCADEKKEENAPPVKLANNWFAKPFEAFVKMYGLPKYKEFDPTMFVAITYTILYGIMFGDLGHGIVLFLAGWFLNKFKNFSLAPIMQRCGISASVFGTLYGSFFGFENALNPLYRIIFGLKKKPIEVMSSEYIPKVLACAILLGVVLLIASMFIKTFNSIKIGDIENSCFGPNGICGMVFYSSILIGTVFQFVLGKKLFSAFYIFGLIILPFILMFFKTPVANLILKSELFPGQTFAEYILQNTFEMFTVILEYITNTVSFLRVGAYVLVHSGLMMAVFMMADMFPPLRVPILVFGNIFVVGFEGLLVGIQVLRLEFYEIFSRCFSSGGKEFSPVKVLRTES